MIDINPDLISSGTAAFIAGLVSSPHCVLMCGPLGCAAFGKQKNSDTDLHYSVYQITRLLSYALVGAVAGFAGAPILNMISIETKYILAVSMLTFFLTYGLGLDKRLIKFKSRKGLIKKKRFNIFEKSTLSSGAALGFLTPLLPCGPLYSIFWVCLFTGSGILSIKIALCFGLGTLPLLWLSRHQLIKYSGILSAKRVMQIQRSLAIAAALVIIWRLSSIGGTEPVCPMCP